MGNIGSVLNSKRHEHELRFRRGLGAYECSGCKGRGANKGYKCQSCPEFVLHETCAASPDEVRDHPFFPNEPFKFRHTSHLRHDCDACGVLIRGFLFESSSGRRVHPLCLKLPAHFRHTGHKNHDLRLNLNEDGEKYSCLDCGKENTNWKYGCRKLTCKARLDMNCALVDIHRLSQHGTQVYKPSQTRRALGKVATVGTAVCTSLLGVAGTAAAAVINREVDHGEGENEEEQTVCSFSD